MSEDAGRPASGGGGHIPPHGGEATNCAFWRDREFEILKPELVIPVGKLGIQQFLAVDRLDEVIGKQFRVKFGAHEFDLIPLPHPSGASPWHRMEPGKTLLERAMKMIVHHPALREITAAARRVGIAGPEQPAA